MKRKISFAFVIMCFITLLSLGDIIQIFPSFLRLFKDFSLIGALRTLCRIIGTLTPVAIAVLLYLNQKQDIKPKAYLVLAICGCAKLLGVALSLSSLAILLASPLHAILWLVNTLSSAILGVLLIIVATSTKTNKTNGAVKGLAFAGMCFGVFMLLTSIFPYLSEMGSASVSSSAKVILLALGLWCLPKTFYNYDQCFFFDSTAVKLLGVIAAVVVLISIVAGGGVGNSGVTDSCGHQSCKEYGPFPCYGKNNTCNNTTNCAYDLYCDVCD